MQPEKPQEDHLHLERTELIYRARAGLRPPESAPWFRQSPEAEGGCGVTGFACSIPVGGRHIYEPSIQMRNRGNGKGGGIAACGLVPEDMGVSRKVLDEDYILQVALLDPSAQRDVEKQSIEPFFDIDQGGLIPTVADHRDVPLLEVKPPAVARYFARVKPAVLARFAAEKGLPGLPEREVEDEFVYQNSVRLNDIFYSALGDKRAFVLSHARNLIILKIVGYAEAAVQYYCMHDARAHVWIAHQRYPTKGRVWHPGGAHPFIGLNEALVHNGDFANYHSVSEYLAQRNVFQKFLTDTEVSVQLFDLMNRVYRYPVEYIIEALAPTTELDFDRLPAEKRRIYRQIQAAHLHAAPDGPWFFIIARSLAETKTFQLLGITDTAMLRPQVFALQEGEVSIGLVCSEKQAIDATLASLAREDQRFIPIADKYWNARGGSYNDGGAFLMTLSPTTETAAAAPRAAGNAPNNDNDERAYTLRVSNKFGQPLEAHPGKVRCDRAPASLGPSEEARHSAVIDQAISTADQAFLFRHLRDEIPESEAGWAAWFVDEIVKRTSKLAPKLGIDALTFAIDRRYPTGNKRKSSLVCVLRAGLGSIFEAQPVCNGTSDSAFVRVGWDSRNKLRAPGSGESTLLIDATGFEPEGPDCDAALAVKAYGLGWRRIIHYNSRGTRFHAAGFGPETDGLRVDCYDNPGDYLGSGMDGLEVRVHGNAQDQLLQIAKRGKAVIYGDVGQTFLYGAKGGEAYVLGNAAGRPMINAVGRPRVVINGTALDYLGESFMAGDPLTGGGFAVVNGLSVQDDGAVAPLESPYPGSNLLSLASGGAIYVRDPHKALVSEQLNGGVFAELADVDFKLILPYLEENERLFGIQIGADLLTVDGELRAPSAVYRKVMPRQGVQHQTDQELAGD
jgi:glutamate synthase domain-containing protein 1/glutamate synthase domain-containing protein 3